MSVAARAPRWRAHAAPRNVRHQVIDLHCHVLPGIDDGPASIDGSLALARAAAGAGTRTLIATPHVSARYPNDAATIARLVEQLNARLAAEAIAVDVRAGAEIALTSALEMEPERLAELALGGGSWLLVEPPYTPAATGVDALVLDIARRGHRVVLAHPERCPAFHRDRAVLESLVRAGVLTSITAGSLVGRFGAQVRRFALALVRDGLVHNVASDAHDHRDRPPGIAAELAQAGLQPLAAWLTCGVPAAILAGGEIPPPPPGALERLRPRRAWPWSRG
ncbi:MAG: tyrosine-protein phosphatase [Solirubrobacteraceae bacterium]